MASNSITLRKITDADIPLLEMWLNSGHVKKWFELPERGIYTEDWLNEVKARHGEFSWLTHLIAELNGAPVGFAVYYDCRDAQEDWYGETARGETYSIDYLIGDPALTGKGYGQEIIRLLTEIIGEKPSAKSIIVQPDNKNLASCGVLKSNGFVYSEDKKYFVLEL